MQKYDGAAYRLRQDPWAAWFDLKSNARSRSLGDPAAGTDEMIETYYAVALAAFTKAELGLYHSAVIA
jgi:hypothetical protein